jgi:hypothetical protein
VEVPSFEDRRRYGEGRLRTILTAGACSSHLPRMANASAAARPPCGGAGRFPIRVNRRRSGQTVTYNEVGLNECYSALSLSEQGFW